MNNINLPVSVGEALDKYSILSIKKDQITDPNRLIDINNEIALIQNAILPLISKYTYHYTCLHNINKEIWDLSSQVRDPLITIDHKNTLFLQTFYKNDARFRIKSKLNKLTSSQIREQKSYPGSCITFNPIDDYIDKNGYIRYLSLCYDVIILQCNESTYVQASQLFHDDPHIVINTDNITGHDINIIHEPIPDLFNKYNFAYDPNMNYICGGKLGDFIHALYVVKCKYEINGKKGHVYITADMKFGGDHFSRDINTTYRELYDVVISQPYVASFSIYQGEKVDINLNTFRYYHNINGSTWLEIMANTFQFPLLERSWIHLNMKDSKYEDLVLIHRSLYRNNPSIISMLETIIQKNKCLFLTCSSVEYDRFPFKHLVPIELKSNLMEMYVAINSCKLFIGNQSSPLAIAYSMFKPALAELTEGWFYDHIVHYEGFNWIGHHGNNMKTLTQYVNL